MSVSGRDECWRRSKALWSRHNFITLGKSDAAIKVEDGGYDIKGSKRSLFPPKLQQVCVCVCVLVEISRLAKLQNAAFSPPLSSEGEGGGAEPPTPLPHPWKRSALPGLEEHKSWNQQLNGSCDRRHGCS